ncbi:MAG: hypothetical protein ACYC61_14045 [Isosphaeraceae bacterium]
MRWPRLHFRLRRMMVAVAVVGIVLSCVKYAIVDNRPRDVVAAALASVDGYDTLYAEGYNESSFGSLRVGMTARQVEEIMGPPLARGEYHSVPGAGPIAPGQGQSGEYWSYARGGKHAEHGKTYYWKRDVYFRKGVVSDIDRTFSID